MFGSGMGLMSVVVMVGLVVATGYTFRRMIEATKK
jgi:hypothetical protein